MATLDLGKIKFVWKGAYAGGTTYEVDDVVSYQGSSYIYKNATSAAGNLPTVNTHWDLLAQGSDLSVLNAQGQILFRGASGLQALAPSTSGYILRTNGAGQNPSWDSLESSLDPATKIDRFHFPKHGYSLASDAGSHMISKDGRVYFGGASLVASGVSSASDLASPTAASGLASNQARHAVLPRGLKAHKVFNFRDNSYVTDSVGNLFSAGVNTNGQLGLGLISSGPAGTTSADTTARARFTQVVFPTHNYPQTGSTETPKIVHVFSNNQENHSDSVRVYAIDTHGFLWTWGDNTNSYMGIGTGLGATIASPVRIPSFMATGTVNLNSAINQPAANGTRKRIKKVTAIAINAETFALVEKDDTTLATESGVFYWGQNSGCTAVGNNTAATISLPTQFSRAALNLNAGEWVVDIFANSTRIEATGSGTFTILTNTGRMLACGTNTYGVLGIGSVTNNFGNLAEISTSTVGGGVWATPTTWVVPAGMTNADFNTQWSGTTFDTQFATFDETWSFSGTFRYAKTANNYWAFWGTQDATGATNRGGFAGVGNITAAQYTPTQLMFRDSQHEENATYRTATDEFGSSQLITGGALGFTISMVRHVGGMWNSTPATNFIRTATIVVMSNGRVYVTGFNTHGQSGSGDAFTSTGFFRRVRIDEPIANEGSIIDARAVRGDAASLVAGFPTLRILYSNGDVYAWGYNSSGSAFLGTSSFVPVRAHIGGFVN